jgi:hypothetical protein
VVLDRKVHYSVRVQRLSKQLRQLASIETKRRVNYAAFFCLLVAEAVKAFEGYGNVLEMLDAFRYEITGNA